MSAPTGTAVRQAVALSRRSIVGIVRQPQLVVPSIVFPLLFTALNTASFSRATAIPGFPAVDSFLDFAVATAVVQGVMFTATSGGSDMAIDIQDGFFDRLVASPISRWTILCGRLAGGAVLGAFQAIVFITVLTLFGATVRGGMASVIAITIVAMILSMAVGGFGLTIALRTGSAEAVQAAFPVFFISLFISSAFFPRELMTGWFKAAAGANPLSWMVEAVRDLVIRGFSISRAAEAIAIAAILGVASISLAALSLRRRVAGP